MNFLNFLILDIFLLILLILLIIIIVLSKLPDSLTLVEYKKREIIDVVFLFLSQFVFLIFYIFYIRPFFSASVRGGIIIDIVFLSLTDLLIPLMLVLIRNNWKLKDFGITTNLRSWPLALFVIFSYTFFGIISYYLFFQRELELLYLLLLLYTNAFLEEFLFRSIIQTKLEKGIGQKKSIVFGGLLFGLSHIPVDIYYLHHRLDIVCVILLFIQQLFHGWIFSIIYMKTRNLFPVVFCHYLANWLGPIILLFL